MPAIPDPPPAASPCTLLPGQSLNTFDPPPPTGLTKLYLLFLGVFILNILVECYLSRRKALHSAPDLSPPSSTATPTSTDNEKQPRTRIPIPEFQTKHLWAPKPKPNTERTPLLPFLNEHHQANPSPHLQPTTTTMMWTPPRSPSPKSQPRNPNPSTTNNNIIINNHPLRLPLPNRPGQNTPNYSFPRLHPPPTPRLRPLYTIPAPSTIPRTTTAAAVAAAAASSSQSHSTTAPTQDKATQTDGTRRDETRPDQPSSAICLPYLTLRYS